MDPPPQTPNLDLAIAALSLLTLGTLLIKGQLSERTLRLGPTRDLGMDQATYVGGALFSIGYVFVMMFAGETGGTAVTMLAALLPLALIGLMIGRAMNTEAGLRKLGLIPRQPMRDLRIGALAVPLSLLFVWAIGLGIVELNDWFGWRMDSIGHESLKQLHESDSSSYLISLIISAVILAPLMEELLFRGMMQTCLVHVFGGWRWPALLYTAAMFSVTHAWVVPWQNLFPLFALGLIFGYVYERTGSLLTPILAHAGFNAVNIIIVLAMPG